jgi:hypothetical protein
MKVRHVERGMENRIREMRKNGTSNLEERTKETNEPQNTRKEYERDKNREKRRKRENKEEIETKTKQIDWSIMEGRREMGVGKGHGGGTDNAEGTICRKNARHPAATAHW